jgi:LacI family transcriptional regulator
MGAYDALKEKGFKIPEDISVVGFDDQELLSAHARPPLTTIRIPYFEMGAWAVELLLKGQPNHNERNGKAIMLECPPVLRASVDKPRTR